MLVAQDTGGEKIAGPHYDEFGVTCTALLDPTHAVTRAFGLVNVPSAVWIDEEGRLVRPPEIAWTKSFGFGSIAVGERPYLDAVRDWVVRGSASEFALTPEQVREGMRGGATRARADAAFALAVHLYQAGRADEAAAPFAEAQRLDPDNWNYHRQPWSFDPSSSGAKFGAKFLTLQGQPYYAEPELARKKK
ncbi:MAG: hypothetical protein O2816_07740 [Planctomycetota bacterium]|nr:hypothetical protein [Planctomycetota bacterium]